MSRGAMLAACAVFMAAAGAGAEVELEAFSFARIRKDISGASNRVDAVFTVRTRVRLEDASARITYVDYRGEAVFTSAPRRLGKVEAGAALEVSVSDVFVPIFNGYVIAVEGRVSGARRSWQFFGAWNEASPFLIPECPYPREVRPVLMSHELEQKSRGPRATLHVRVRNLGAQPATELHATVEVMGRGGETLGKVRAKLGKGTLAGGEEKLFPLGFASFPPYESYRVTLEWKSPPAEVRLAGGEFEGIADIEVARLAFKREGKRLEVSGEARNGLDREVENLRVTLLFARSGAEGVRAEARIAGPLGPGKTAPFSAVVNDLGQFDDLEYAVAFDVADASAAGMPSVRIDAAEIAEGALKIAGAVRNTSNARIARLEITFNLMRAGASVAKMKCVALDLAPGESRPFETAMANPPDFDEYFYELGFGPGDGGAGN